MALCNVYSVTTSIRSYPDIDLCVVACGVTNGPEKYTNVGCMRVKVKSMYAPIAIVCPKPFPAFRTPHYPSHHSAQIVTIQFIFRHSHRMSDYRQKRIAQEVLFISIIYKTCNAYSHSLGPISDQCRRY